MTTEPANKVIAIIENISVRRRSEETARVFANISFPVNASERLLPLLAAQLKQSIGLIFEELQARLPERADDPDAYEDEMIVNGEPAKVRRPRRNAQEWAAHYFLESEHAGLCATCHRREDDELHLRTTADSVEAQDALSETAQSLIESIGEPDPNADVTEDQQAARERLAAKSAT